MMGSELASRNRRDGGIEEPYWGSSTSGCGQHWRPFDSSFEQEIFQIKTRRTLKFICLSLSTMIYYFFNLYASIQLVKHNIVTAVIYCYITIEFHYAKRDSCLLVYGGVMLQWLGV